jgi:alkylated DNA nucleotide flippase Atl1
VRETLAKVPRGKVISWDVLAALAGAPTDFSMRGMPGLLKKAATRGLPAHRVVDSSWCTISRHLPEQDASLEAEGVRICSQSGLVLDKAVVAWSPSHEDLYLTPVQLTSKDSRT